MVSDYYDLLEISENSSFSEVRRAYRVLVKRYHPDVSNHPDAQTRFKQIKEGYEVLNNRKKRKKYDRLTHDEFVKQYGGYSSDELEQTAKTKIVRRAATTGYSQTGNSQESAATDSRDSSSESSSSSVEPESGPSSNKSWFGWILQGRTSESNGYLAYTIRISLFTFVLFFANEVLKYLSGGVGAFSSVASAVVFVLIARLCYLVGFEQLRHSHIKIDEEPEPDAYTVPYAIVIGIIGLTFASLMELISIVTPPGIGAVISLLVFLGVTLYFVGCVAAVLAIGWGVADDYYNLGFDVSPILWNFAAQSPLLIAVVGLITEDIFLFAVSGFSLLVGLLYIYLYHAELIEEFRWRFSNRTIFSTH